MKELGKAVRLGLSILLCRVHFVAQSLRDCDASPLATPLSRGATELRVAVKRSEAQRYLDANAEAPPRNALQPKENVAESDGWKNVNEINTNAAATASEVVLN